MQAQQAGGTPVPIPGVVALGIVAWGILQSQPLLESSRPFAVEFPETRYEGVEKLPSRLWQDPLMTVYRADAADQAAGLDSSTQPEDLQQALDADNTLVLPVMLHGRVHAEDRENRLRTRVAVVSALTKASYVADKAERIGYLRLARKTPSPRPGTRRQTPTLTKPASHHLVPFEIFAGHDGSTRHYVKVLVLYVDGEQTGIDLHGHLRQIVGSAVGDRHDVHVLGPLASGDLKQLVSPADKPASVAVPAIAKSTGAGVWKYFAAWPTAANARIQADLEKDQRVFDLPAFDIERVGASDSHLVDRLYEEIDRRGLVRDGSCVALLYEQDTLYGDGLARDLENRLKVGAPDSHVERIPYLQGIDGQDAARPDDGSDRSGRVSASDEPEGRDALDYLRRVADTLNDHEHKVTAVGILGSDVYDKLLILRALRPVLEDAVFFTTDLDARFAHATEQQWTRNLIVASGFGLSLKESLQRGAAPFRDTYQTGSYLACLKALKLPTQQGEDEGPVQAAAKVTAFEPRLFEIGHSGAFDLDAHAEAEASPHPRGNRLDALRWGGGGVTIALLLALVATIALVARQHVVRRWLQFATSSARRRILVVAGGTTITVLLVSVALALPADARAAGGEPWAVFEGISAWPSILLRLFAFGLALLYIARVLRLTQRTDQRTAARFGLSNPASHSGGQGPWLAVCWSQLQSYAAPENPGGTSAAEEVWREHCRYATMRNRVGRALLLTAAYMATAGVLFGALGTPVDHIRSAVARGCNIAVLMAAVVSMVFLIFLVLDASLLCARLIRQLARGRVTWKQSPGQPGEGGLLDAEEQGELHKTRLIADHTKVPGRIVYFPFVVLLIIVCSRHAVFDRWGWSPALLIVLTAHLLLMAAAAIVVRKRAERSRSSSLSWLRGRRSARLVALQDAWPDSGSSEDPRIVQVDMVADEIRGTSGGAFSSWGQSPVVRAVVLPLGGISGLALLEWLVR